MFMPQVEWIKNNQGEIEMDFIARFESLDHDFPLLCARLGLGEIALPRLKASERGPYRQFYDDQSLDIVSDYFGQDIDQFGYSF
jgi:hypothetical protein